MEERDITTWVQRQENIIICTCTTVGEDNNPLKVSLPPSLMQTQCSCHPQARLPLLWLWLWTSLWPSSIRMPHLRGALQHHNFSLTVCPTFTWQSSLMPGPQAGPYRHLGLIPTLPEPAYCAQALTALTSLMYPPSCSQSSLENNFQRKVSRTMITIWGSGLWKAAPPWLSNYKWVT